LPEKPIGSRFFGAAIRKERLFAAVLASSLLNKFAAERPPLILEIDVSEFLAVAYDKAGV
jgi:hypothetical protein